jgi:hypothetical protein
MTNDLGYNFSNKFLSFQERLTLVNYCYIPMRYNFRKAQIKKDFE